ncbi:MAG: hypothetical protein JWR90_746, partial [Marmoricola sp.]|nr:hypothetical protein [Marmoricola sp.]
TGLFATALLLSGASVALPAAYAVDNVTITGTVVDPGGDPVADYPVFVYRKDPGSGGWSLVGDVAYTNGSGSYTAAGTTAGTYRVSFGDGTGEFLPEFWNNARSLGQATDVPADTGQVVPNINATLDLGGVITGRVTDVDNSPLAGADVDVFRRPSPGVWESIYDEGSTITTDGSGNFSVVGLPTGTYRVGASKSSTSARVFYNGSRTVESATDVPVTQGSTAALGDLRLRAASAITGVVTDSLSGNPLPDIRVTAARFVDNQWSVDSVCVGSSPPAKGSAVTGGNGRYTIFGLDAGEYRIEFCDPATGSPHAFEYSGNATSLAGGTSINLAAYQVYGSDVSTVLEPGGTISGTISVPGGGHPECVDVRAYQQVAQQWVLAPTSFRTDRTTGSYTLEGLNTGPYRLQAQKAQGCNGDAGVVPSWATTYSGSADTIETATAVPATRGAPTPDVDITMKAGGAGPSGRVTATNGEAAPGLVPTVYRKVGTVWTVYRTFGTTGPDGAYSIDDLATGTYRMGFVDPTGTTATRYWGAQDVHQARDFTVSQGQASAQIDVNLAERVTDVVTVPSITGTPMVGLALTANPGTFSPEAGSHTYQWLADGVAIRGATGKYFVPTAAQVNRRLSVQTTGSGAGYASSAATTSGLTSVVRKRPVAASVTAANTRTADVLTVRTGQRFTSGAPVTFYRQVGRSWSRITARRLNSAGAVALSVPDRKKKATTYYAVVGATGSTNADNSNAVRIK